MYLRSKIYLLYVSLSLTAMARAGAPSAPTFNKDVLPILQTRCQPCHRPGEIAPMPLVTYEQTKPWAKAIVDVMKAGKMPPWYSDRCCGQFSPEHVLKPEEIATIDAWVNAGTLEGKKKEGPRPIAWTNDWKIDGPSVVISLPRAFEVPANAKIDDQYVILTLDLAQDKWASSIEIHPSDKSVVDHAVLYVRTKDSTWVRNQPKLTMFTQPAGAVSPDEILAVYTPGSPATVWPENMGKKLTAGSDLVLQIHYTSRKATTTDRTSVGINFLKDRPEKRVLTMMMQNPGTLSKDALLVSVLPEAAAGGDFTFGTASETLVTAKPYDPAWQQNYPLKTPRLLPKGTKLTWSAVGGYFDIAIDATSEKATLVTP